MRTRGNAGKRVRAAEAEHRHHFSPWDHRDIAVRSTVRLYPAYRAILQDVPDESTLQRSDAGAVLRFNLRRLNVAHSGGQVRMVSDSTNAPQIARGAVKARQNAGTD